MYSFVNGLSGKLFLVLNIEIHTVGYVIQCNAQCSVLRLLFILMLSITDIEILAAAGCLSQEPTV